MFYFYLVNYYQIDKPSLTLGSEINLDKGKSAIKSTHFLDFIIVPDVNSRMMREDHLIITKESSFI